MSETEDQLKAFQDLASKTNVLKAQGYCPHCGVCPTCGRHYGNFNYPIYPQPFYPSYPYYPAPIITCKT